MHERRDGTWVRVIGVAKLLKAALLAALALVLLTNVDGDLAESLARWSTYVHVDPRNHHLHHAMARLTGMTPGHRELFGAAGLAYAALFATEGVGLLLAARWAEWLTVIATTSFIPMEIYELARALTATRVLLLLANVAVVVYLVVRLRRKQ